jgi:anti-sigma-K factor RskA
MKPEKQNLIRDLLDEDSMREATLLAGAQILRRRRHWRVARRGVAVMVLVALAAGLVLRKGTGTSPQVAVATTKAAPVSQVHEMTDDELLALFPNTPVALASLPDGKKRLLFPRPGDEQKFIKRL